MKARGWSGAYKTESVSGPHWTRRKARRVERHYTETLCYAEGQGASFLGRVLRENDWPIWVRGFRVARVGRFGRVWQVEATSWKGH